MSLESHPNFCELKVLLVEDNKADIIMFHESVGEATARMLTEYPRITIGVCHSIKEAEDALITNHYDLLVLDLVLPDCESLEGLRYLIEKFSHVPIVIHSGVYSRKLAWEALAMGAEDCIPKGTMKNEELIRTLVHAKLRHDQKHKLKQLLALVQ